MAKFYACVAAVTLLAMIATVALQALEFYDVAIF